MTGETAPPWRVKRQIVIEIGPERRLRGRKVRIKHDRDIPKELLVRARQFAMAYIATMAPADKLKVTDDVTFIAADLHHLIPKSASE